MEETIKPNKKLYTKTIWVLLTVSAFTLAPVSITHLIIYIADGDPNAPTVIWIIAVIVILVIWLIVYPIAILWIRNPSYLIQSERILKNKAALYI